MRSSYDVLKRQLITEKTTKLADELKYTFEVDQDANRLEVKLAVEEIFDRKVANVRIVNVRKKPKKMGRYEGFKPAVKKAIVQLTADSADIEIFQGL